MLCGGKLNLHSKMNNNFDLYTAAVVHIPQQIRSEKGDAGEMLGPCNKGQEGCGTELMNYAHWTSSEINLIQCTNIHGRFTVYYL